MNKDNPEDNCLCDNHNMDFFENDIITLIDEKGVEREFEALDYLENSCGKFYALAPNFELEDASIKTDETYFIFEIVNNGEDDELVEVNDEKLLSKLSAEFEKRLGML